MSFLIAYNGLAMCSADIKTTQLNYNDMKTNIVGTPKGIGTKALHIGDVSGSLFGFEIDGRLIELKAKSEKHALIQLVKNYWELIDKSGKIELLGGRK